MEILLMSPTVDKRERPVYIDLVPNQDFITPADLAQLIGLTQGSPINATAGWLHYTFAGKNVYVAQKTIRTSFSWNNLNSAGAVYGKEVTIQGKQYRVRLMTGATTDPGSTPGGEWNDYMYCVSANPPDTYYGPRYANFTNSELYVGGSGNGRASYTQEAHSNGNAYNVNRGFLGIDALSVSTKSLANTNSGWRPLIEEI